MTTLYTPPYNLQELSMANNDFLLYDNSVDNILGSSNNATVDQMEDLLWNFDYTNFAINDDADSKLFDTALYNVSTENQCDTANEWDYAMQTYLSSPDMSTSSPSLTHSSSRRSSRSSSQSISRSTSPASESLPTVVKPKRKRSPVVNKAAHNKVEKRYRSNINAKFAALNNILPVFEAVQSLLKRQDGTDESVQQHRNKGEVLSEAMRYIKQLEERSRVLEGEVRILKDNLLPRKRKN